ncbi:rhodanese-like domain-containing protein [uncultured Pseudodesulfovibrio sp.]|uniref:rhodanese-like domain-containing protein n=1 Tax=uncultured Pseudodesulfovibrio sp. TaxID=2035858 RepID=UPI0029C67B0E|nr:rhodanese-like domain-containing protein [uncultured Pseudodesulfovibrio sp.]
MPAFFYNIGDLADSASARKHKELRMEEFNDILEEMDFDFFSTGEHGMSVEAMRHAIGNDHFFFLDVRTNEEVAHVSFPFATHIPLEELPERLNEVPRDKFVVTFCAAIFRGAIAYAYLRANGYDEVKGLTAPLEGMVMPFKPGPLGQLKK